MLKAEIDENEFKLIRQHANKLDAIKYKEFSLVDVAYHLDENCVEGHRVYKLKPTKEIMDYLKVDICLIPFKNSIYLIDEPQFNSFR